MGNRISWIKDDIELLTEMYVRGDKPSEIVKHKITENKISKPAGVVNE